MRRRPDLNSRRWRALRIRVLTRDLYRCTNCGGAGRLECHHVLPVAHGGKHYEENNLATLCRSCHIDHHCQGKRTEGKAFAEWRELLQE